MTKKTSKPTEKAKPSKATKPKTPNDGRYKEHVEGSRKGKIHELFDTQGADAAWTLGLKLQLKPTTLRSWFGAWKRAAGAKPAKPVKANGSIKEQEEVSATT